MVEICWDGGHSRLLFFSHPITTHGGPLGNPWGPPLGRVGFWGRPVRSKHQGTRDPPLQRTNPGTHNHLRRRPRASRIDESHGGGNVRNGGGGRGPGGNLMILSVHMQFLKGDLEKVSPSPKKNQRVHHKIKNINTNETTGRKYKETRCKLTSKFSQRNTPWLSQRKTSLHCPKASQMFAV